jgi:hypothetical protein
MVEGQLETRMSTPTALVQKLWNLSAESPEQVSS